MYRGFVTGNGFRRLGDTLRFCRRLKNDWKNWRLIHIATATDAESRKRPAGVAAMVQQTTPARREDEDVKEIRWMIEELPSATSLNNWVRLIRFRISVFAGDGAD